jgi:hypothetical protein
MCVNQREEPQRREKERIGEDLDRGLGRVGWPGLLYSCLVLFGIPTREELGSSQGLKSRTKCDVCGC